MRESKGGSFELVQALDETLPSLRVDDTPDMENYHSATDSRTQRLHASNLHDCSHQDSLVTDNNRYHMITKQQQNEDAVEYSFDTSTRNAEPTEPTTVIPITRATMIYVLCAALNSCNLGYDIGVSTNVSKLIQNDIHITNAQREIWIGFINFWAIFGAFLAQYFTDRYGRRTTFFVAAIGFIVGLFIMVVSSSYNILLLGRSFVGMGVGVGLAIDPLYIAEVVPTQHRGRLVTYSEIALNIGIVFGFSTGLIFAPMIDNIEWRCMLALGTVLPMLMIVLLSTGIMPESPRWLVSNGRLIDARNVLQNIYPTGHDIDRIIQEISESITLEQVAERHAIGWKTIFCPTPAIRRMMLVGVGTAVAQQVVGIDAIQYYLIDVIERLGIPSDTYQSSIILILLGTLKLAMIVVGGRLFDKHGRRPLFFVSLIGMAIALLSISIVFLMETSLLAAAANITVLVGLAFYLSFFSIGIGPGGWLIPSEIFSLSIRGRAMSIATICNRIAATVMSSTFLSTVRLIGWSGFFFMLFFICIIILGCMYYYLPETNGQSLESMALYFAEITGDTYILDAEARIIANSTVTPPTAKNPASFQSYHRAKFGNNAVSSEQSH